MTPHNGASKGIFVLGFLRSLKTSYALYAGMNHCEDAFTVHVPECCEVSFTFPNFCLDERMLDQKFLEQHVTLLAFSSDQYMQGRGGVS